MNIHATAVDIDARTLAIIEDYKDLEGNLLPILHGIQAEFGYVPAECQAVIARALNLSRAEVHGVVSFYHDYRAHPAGRHVLRICRAEACQSMGGDHLADRAKAMLGIDWHQTTLDGAVTLEPVFCLGLCACAPAAILDDEVHGRVDVDCLQGLITEARS